MLGESVLKKIKFIIICLITIFFIFLLVSNIVFSRYEKKVRVVIDNQIVGYFESEEEFSDTFTKLKSELSAGYETYDIYINNEPKIETMYVKKDILVSQNKYTQLRGFIKTKYTLFAIYLNNEKSMEFVNKAEAEKYYNEIKNSTVNLPIELKAEVKYEKTSYTSIDKAESIKLDMVSRYKPIEIPKVEEVIVPVQTTFYPTTTRYISCRFGEYFGHSGIDLAGPLGSPIYAYKTGTVILSGWVASYGNCILIDHGNGIVTRYAHLTKSLVRNGQSVSGGQKIGLMGSTGNSTGSHLHFEYILNNKCIDPYNYIF